MREAVVEIDDALVHGRLPGSRPIVTPAPPGAFRAFIHFAATRKADCWPPAGVPKMWSRLPPGWGQPQTWAGRAVLARSLLEQVASNVSGENVMRRRDFTKLALAGSAATIAAPAVVKAQTTFNWKMTSFY